MFSKACIAAFVAAAAVSASHEASPAKPTRPNPSQSQAIKAAIQDQALSAVADPIVSSAAAVAVSQPGFFQSLHKFATATDQLLPSQTWLNGVNSLLDTLPSTPASVFESLAAGELRIVESVLSTKLNSISPETTKVLDKRETVSPAVSAPAQNEVFSPLLAGADGVEKVVANDTVVILPLTTYTVSAPSFTLVTPTSGPAAGLSTSTKTVTDPYNTDTVVVVVTPITISPQPKPSISISISTLTPQPAPSPVFTTVEKPIGWSYTTGLLYSTSTSVVGAYVSMFTVPTGAAPLATGVGVAGLGAAALGAAVALL